MANQAIKLISWMLAGITLIGCTSPPKTTPIATATLSPTLTTPVASTETSPELRLSLALSLDKDKYAYIGQTVCATLTFRNEGKESFLFNKRLVLYDESSDPAFRDFFFRIEGPSGNEVHFDQFRLSSPWIQSDFTELSPGETIEVKSDLSQFYLLDTIGQYSAKAVYENGFDPPSGRKAWKGQLESNTVSFVIEGKALPTETPTKESC